MRFIQTIFEFSYVHVRLQQFNSLCAPIVRHFTQNTYTTSVLAILVGGSWTSMSPQFNTTIVIILIKSIIPSPRAFFAFVSCWLCRHLQLALIHSVAFVSFACFRQTCTEYDYRQPKMFTNRVQCTRRTAYASIKTTRSRAQLAVPLAGVQMWFKCGRIYSAYIHVLVCELALAISNSRIELVSFN